MGIELHTFNFLWRQSNFRQLGEILTIGRQSFDISEEHVLNTLGFQFESTDGYCEPLLIAMGAENVSSIDFSDYEGATYVADLNREVYLGKQFDSVIDAGSLEHIFDIAAAFRNCIRFCKLNGRIFHTLPVNNLSGHGFWQFTSDLIYSIYSQENGFKNTKVFYASGIDFSQWFEVSEAKPGMRIESASVEPIVLLSVTEKVKNVEFIRVVQPFYQNAWNESDASKVISGPRTNALSKILRRVLKKRGKFINLLRNTWFVFTLLTGKSRFSITRFRRVATSYSKNEKKS